MGRPTVEFVPEERTGLVTLHDHWRADNGFETSVFPTEAEAVKFSRNRWGREPLVIGREPSSDR